jgi:hypothetical protein
MPKNIQSWTTCLPQDENSFVTDYGKPGNWIGIGIQSILKGFVAGIASAGALTLFVEYVLGQSIGLGCLGGTWALGGLVYLFVEVIHWFDNERLRCMEESACAVGTVVHTPHSNNNGDLNLDIAVAPFSPLEQEEVLRSEIKSQHGSAPLGSVMTYIFLASLLASQRLNLFWHMVGDHFLKWPSDRRFQDKYFIETQFVKDLFAGDKEPTPVYRCPSDDRDEAEKWSIPSPITDGHLQNMFVYLPCLIEGHVIGEWLRNLRNAAIAALAGFVIGCLVCMVFTLGAGEFACAAVGAVVAAIFAFLAWLISHLTNDPNDSKADNASGIDTSDAAGGDAPKTSAERGDVIVAFGSWVLNTLENQFYEIHPVKAWYLVCRGSTIFEKAQISSGGCHFDTSRMESADYERICRMIHEAETDVPAQTSTQSIAAGLSMSGGLR